MSTMRTGVAAAVASVVGYVNRPYSPTYLFQNGEQGFWYDPSDFSTLFQDAAGTTPVTAVEQPCSLMLDKRLGLVLGSELVTNGNFATNSDWTLENGWSISDGKLRYSDTGTGREAYQAVSTVSGKWYLVRFDVDSISAGQVGVYSLQSNITSAQFSPATGTRYAYLLATGASMTVRLRSSAAGSGNIVIDNVSVRELPGNHAYTPAAASTARPTVSARVNLLTKTEQFDDAAWTKSNITVTPNTDGVADTIVENLVNGFHNVSQNVASTTVSNTVRFRVKPAGRTWCWIQLGTFVAYFNLSGAGSTGTVNANLTASISPAIGATGYYDLVVSGTPASNICNFGLATADATASYAGDGTSGITITYADLRVANDGVGIPNYQRVNTASDYDVSGFPVYLRFDQSNDYMLTNSIDFSGTDKVTVAAGIRKLSDAATGMLMELSANSSNDTNTFRMTGAILTVADYNFASRGSLALSNAQVSVGAYPAPITNVLTGIGDISGDSAILRINGTQVASSTADQGTGNYGNYPIYLFSRAGTSLFFNGRFYGGVGRGAQSNDQQIAALEAYMNTKTAAY
jgi:hypothetical protein